MSLVKLESFKEKDALRDDIIIGKATLCFDCDHGAWVKPHDKNELKHKTRIYDREEAKRYCKKMAEIMG